MMESVCNCVKFVENKCGIVFVLRNARGLYDTIKYCINTVQNFRHYPHD